MRALLEGPVNSTPTTFGPDGTLDLDGVRAMVEHPRGRFPVVAAGRRWPTGKEVDFAPYRRELGVDVCMLLPGMKMQGSPDLAIHHCAVAAVMPVMLVGSRAFMS
jgi:dihydrodipicolinate synthase/N-acetylneuraminate lyase